MSPSMTSSAAPAGQADLVIEGGRVLTMDLALPEADVLAVRGERIVYVGDRAGARAWTGAATRRLDAGGATVLPGLIDCHGHLLSYGESLTRLDLQRVPSFEVLAELTAAHAANLPKGRWILGRGWDSSLWGGDDAVDLELLSRAVPDHPVFLKRHDGHAAIVNQAALHRTGLDASHPDPADGALARRHGALTGLLVENAARLVSDHIPEPQAAERRELMAMAGQRCLALGLTGVFDAIDSIDWIGDLHALLAQGTPMPRVFGMLRAQEAADPAALARHHLFMEAQDGRFTLRRLRMILDGGMGARGARMHEPYLDDEGTRGFLMLDPARVAAASRAALEGGWSMCVHAIGDEAIDLLLDAWEPLLRGRSPQEHRFMVEHCVVPSDAALARLARLGVILSVQPLHAVNVARWIENRLGPARAAHAYAFRRLQEAGLALAFGSDVPVASPDPRLGIMAGITRAYTDAGGTPRVTLPGERLALPDMIAGYTRTAARAAFAEDQLGMLRSGFRADAVVLDGDLPEMDPHHIGLAAVRWTLQDGRVVHEA